MTMDDAGSDRDRFAEQVFASSLGYFDILSIHLGLRLGLYRALADGGAMTSAELASAAAIDERYAREWLEQQATRAILLADHGPEPTRFTLPPGHAEVLLDGDSLSFLGAGITPHTIPSAVDALLMRITDMFLVLPTFVLALILAPIILEIVGSEAEIFGIRMTLIVIVVVIGLTSWASTARVIRSQVLSLKQRAFVDRARVIGSGGAHIMRRHLLPNVMNLLIANTVLTFAGAVLTETTLSFIGLGDPFQPSWGQILNDAQVGGAPSLGAWWWVLGPAACIVLVVLAFTLVGDALDEILNPTHRIRR
jgi:ABC-type amino acid transport system permease subunit